MRNSTVVKAIYNGNDVARRWSIPFEYIKTEEIGVILTTTILGNDSEEVVSTDDYTIDTDTNEVVYPSDLSEPPVETGKKVTIYRTTDLLQKTDFTNQGAVWPEAIEDSLDKLHQIVQEHTEEIGRAFKTNKSSSVSPEQYAEALIAASDAAVTAASNAAISETNAGNSATSASNSATAAHNSELAAASSETNAGLSATAAGNSATAAHNSELAAAFSETNAGNSATAAHNSELAAASSETNAGNSATAAGNYATAAHNSEVAAEAAESRISDRWGLRKKSTIYAADDMAYHVDLPTGWYLECTTDGTTSASDLVITSPSVGDTVTDGTVTWTIRAVASTADIPAPVDISGKANVDLDNLSAAGEAKIQSVSPRYLTDSYYDANTGNWWRKYSDGWVEQGGLVTSQGNNADVTVSLLIAMSNDKYYLATAAVVTSDAGANHYENMSEFKAKTTTGFTKYCYHRNANVLWIAVGKMA